MPSLRTTDAPTDPFAGRLALSQAEAAQALGCSERHLHDLVKRGEIPVPRSGRRTLISVDVLRDWLRQPAAGSEGGAA